MKTGLYQGTQLKQEMKINPRLYQAMDLLYMPLLDLQQHLKQELLNNPFLEMGEDVEVEEPVQEEPEKEAEEEPFVRMRPAGKMARANGSRQLIDIPMKGMSMPADLWNG